MFSSFTTTRASSQSSLSQGASQASTKQIQEHVVGELASTYGYSGSLQVPTPLSRASSPSPKPSRRSALHHQSPATSTAVAVPPPTASPKNYEQSYGSLVSTTAFGAGVPSLNLPRAQKKATSESRTATSTALTLSRVPSSSHSSLSHKDYEHGFRELAKTYEFGTHLSAPSLSRV